MDYKKMPTNPFDNFFLSWTPDRKKLFRPYYLSLANSLEADIVSGNLAAGTKLPPQRELADYLDLNFTTVTRAYDLCREKNLIYGVVGRGTFVAPLPGGMTINKPSGASSPIELGLVTGFSHIKTPVIEATEKVLQKGYIGELYSYTEPSGHLHQRAAGAHWMARMDVMTDSEHTAIFSGAQNAISTALLSLFRLGDKLAVDEYTYSNLMGAAKLSHIQLLPVRGDEQGMRPEELESLCRKTPVAGVFLMPNCANPTTCTLSEKRKDELAEIILRYKLILIEDDNTGTPLPATTAYHSMFTRLPEQTVYVCNSTMALCSGLRVAFAAFPEKFRAMLLNALFHLNIKTSSLDAEIMAELILSGKGAKILEQKTSLAVERNTVFDRVFPRQIPPGSPAAFFRWLPLPQLKFDGMTLERELLARGVNVYHSRRFTVKPNSEGFLRFAISSPGSCEELEQGLVTVKSFLKENALSETSYLDA